MGTITRGYRIRAYPNGAQRRLLDRWSGATGWLWNTALGIRSEAYRHFGLRLSGNDISKWLTGWKKTRGHEWLAEVPATCLTQCLRDQDRAFSNFFAKRAQYPRRKPKAHAGTLRFQDVSESNWARRQVSLPKLGWLKLAEALPDVAQPDMVTLTRDAAGRYFVSFKAEVVVETLPATDKAVGVDLGLKHLATLSSAEKVPAPRHYANRLRYLRRQQRWLARRQKGSNRRNRQRVSVARAHARVADARTHGLHELTTRLVREFDVIAIENLNVKALGRGLHARSIHDAAFGEFRRQLRYKTQWYGKTLIEVDRFYPSSKTCSSCGHVLGELRLDQREWTCPQCGMHHDRDLNAAQNLEREGLRILASPLLPAGSDCRSHARGRERYMPGAHAPGQVLPVEARSGQSITTGLEPVAVD